MDINISHEQPRGACPGGARGLAAALLAAAALTLAIPAQAAQAAPPGAMLGDGYYPDCPAGTGLICSLVTLAAAEEEADEEDEAAAEPDTPAAEETTTPPDTAGTGQDGQMEVCQSVEVFSAPHVDPDDESRPGLLGHVHPGDKVTLIRSDGFWHFVATSRVTQGQGWLWSDPHHYASLCIHGH